MTFALALLAASKPFEVPSAGELFNYETLFNIGPLEVTYPTLVMFGVTALLALFFLKAFARPKVVPTGSQNLAEAGIEFVTKQITGPVLGEEAIRWTPYLTIVFFWVLLLNLMGIIPGVQFPITSRTAYPALLAVIAWVIYNAIGIKNQGPIGYFKNMMFPPGVPVLVYFILAPIELISTIIIRPATLALRLFANMVAGHMLLTVLFLSAGVFFASGIGKATFILPFGFGVIFMGFEIFVAFMQAFIITILMAVYIAGAQKAHH
ncbi:MAG: F0F1 ATP synthase subunit A [Actinomycetota bacterium]